MCECGCGESMSPVMHFAGPAGFIYALGLYPGCLECSNPAGIVVYRIPESAWNYDTFGPSVEESTPAPFHAFHGWEEFTIPVIGRDGLLAAMREEAGASGDSDEEMSLEDGSRGYVQAAGASFAEFLRRAAPSEPGEPR